MTTHFSPDRLEWAPLEMVARLGLIDADDYMWMAVDDEHADDRPRRIHHYKHRDTRDYLYVDQHGHTYARAGDAFVLDARPTVRTSFPEIYLSR